MVILKRGAVVDLDDPTGDILVFSIECLSCPLVKITTVMRTTNGKVLSYAHGLSTGDVIKVSNVIGMPELSGSLQILYDNKWWRKSILLKC